MSIVLVIIVLIIVALLTKYMMQKTIPINKLSG
jgi:hypothetical protein